MVTIVDQIKLSLGLPLDIRQSNFYVEGSNIIVETIPQYLLRVDDSSRYLGLEVVILNPSGTYDISSFVDLINDGEISRKKYAFYSGLLDEDFLEIRIDGVTIIDNLIDGGSNVVLSAEQGKILKQLIDSAEVGLDNDIISDVTVGAINAGDTLQEGLGLTELFIRLLVKTYYPTFTNPFCTLSYTGVTSQEECGTITNINLSLLLNRGSILGKVINNVWNTSDQQDYRSGSAINYTINGVDLDLTSTYTLSNTQILLGSNTINGIIDYGTGPQPLDSKGNNYQTPLSSGSVSNSITITGYRKAFYGVKTTTNILTSSAEVRALSNSVLNPISGTTFTINIPIGSKMIVFAIPSTLSVSSIQYIEGLFAEVKGNFTETILLVSGANNYSPVNYKLYTFIPPSAFATICNYKVTLL